MKEVLNLMFKEWKLLLEQDEGINSSEISLSIVRDISVILLENSNKEIYSFLRQEESTKADLLMTFCALCRQESVNISNIKNKTIWLSVVQRKVNYSKFSDLL